MGCLIACQARHGGGEARLVGIRDGAGQHSVEGCRVCSRSSRGEAPVIEYSVGDGGVSRVAVGTRAGGEWGQCRVQLR